MDIRLNQIQLFPKLALLVHFLPVVMGLEKILKLYVITSMKSSLLITMEKGKPFQKSKIQN